MSDSKKAEKVELPLCDDGEVQSLVRRFEACTFPYENWTHRAHLAVAVFYIRQYSFDIALARIRKNVKAYNRECGDPDGYHETITIVFLKKVEAESKRDNSCTAMHEEVERLAKLCTVEWLYTHYSRDVIWSSVARSNWVPPDLGDLDFDSCVPVD